MAELDRVGSIENFNFGVVLLFLQVCEKCSQKTQKVECLYSDGLATYL